MPTRRIACFLLFLGGLTAGPDPAQALWGRLRVGAAYEAGSLVFDELADFTGFVLGGSGEPDTFEKLRYELDDVSSSGFRVLLDLDPDFTLGWSRQHADSRYRVWVNGTEVFDDPTVDPKIEIGGVDLRLDIISLTWRPTRFTWRGLGPVARLGYGWVLLSQQKPFRPTPGRLPVDYSDSDGTWEMSVGVEARWRFLRAGGDLRTLHWRWDPKEDLPRVPGRTTHALAFSAWVGASF